MTDSIRADQGSKACDRFSLPEGWRFLHDGGRLQRGPSEGSPKVCARCPPSAIRNHAGGDAGAAPRASSDHYQLLPGIGRQSAQGFLSSVLKNQGNRLAKVCQAFLARLALPVGAWHFGAVPDIPGAVLLDYRREFVAHFFILPAGGWNRAGAAAAQIVAIAILALVPSRVKRVARALHPVPVSASAAVYALIPPAAPESDRLLRPSRPGGRSLRRRSPEAVRPQSNR